MTDREERLHDLALSFMRARFDLTPCSLDEWLTKNNARLTPYEKVVGIGILRMIEEEETND